MSVPFGAGMVTASHCRAGSWHLFVSAGHSISRVRRDCRADEHERVGGADCVKHRFKSRDLEPASFSMMVIMCLTCPIVHLKSA